MELVIESHIREFGSKRSRGQYSEATIKNYLSAIRSLHKQVEGPALFNDLDWAREHQRVIDVVNKRDNIQTRRNLINGLIVSLQTIGFPPEVIRPYEVLRDKLNEQYQSGGALTTNQKTIMTAVSKQDILDFLQKESKDPGLSQDLTRLCCFVVLTLHTRYPFRNELGNMKAIRRALYDKFTEKERNKNNWLILEKGFSVMTFAMTSYKTKGVYGIREIEVEKKYIPFLLKIFQMREIPLADVNFKSVLVNSKGAEFTANKLSKFLGAYTLKGLGHSISTTLMAKIFGSVAADPANPTVAELLQMSLEADQRGHSLKPRFSRYLTL